MDLWYFLFELVMLLGGAFLFGALAQRFKQSPILGYLLAGTIIGPILFNAEAVSQSAELGVSLLLFAIGLEFSFKRIKQLGRLAIGGGTIQVTATLACVCLLLLPWVKMPQAITIGAIVALSSTAVVMRMLVDRSEIDSIRGRSCLAILLLQDMAIVPLVIMVSLFSPEAAQSGIAVHILKVVASAGGLGLGLYILLYKGVPLLLASRGVFTNRELTVLLALAIGLGASLAAHAMGVSPALGAFVAGMLLGESPFATQIRADIGAVRIIMVTLFFASVGMLAKPLWFITHMHWIIAAGLSIFILKAVIIFGTGRLFGLNNRQSLATGISLAQVGEFSFVLAATAMQGGLLGGNSYDLVISVIILLMFAAPYMVEYAFPMTDRVLAMVLGRPSAAHLQIQSEKIEPSQKVLLVGLGPCGQEVVRHLQQRNMTPLVIDNNPQSRVKAYELGVKVHLGDATHEELLLHAGLPTACMAVVTVPDPSSAVQIVSLIRQLRPSLPIAARCRYHRHLAAVKEAGATITVDEESHVGHRLAHQIVAFMQLESGESLACRLVGKPLDEEAPPSP
ncbi:MAG: cation:proton antiporter [Desulfobacteraceae bacterium]